MAEADSVAVAEADFEEAGDSVVVVCAGMPVVAGVPAGDWQIARGVGCASQLMGVSCELGTRFET